MAIFDSLPRAEQARHLANPEGRVGIEVAEWLNGNNREGNARTLAMLGVQAGHRVLEIGFGNGRARIIRAPTDCRSRSSGGAPWPSSNETTKGSFTPTSKRRRGFPSETRVKRGHRYVHGDKELIRETRPERSLPVRVREVVSRNAA